MVTICQKCGDRGFPEALVYCVECKAAAEHRYCLDRLPDSLNEDIIWTCQDCLSRVAGHCTLDTSNPTPQVKSNHSCIRGLRAAQARRRPKWKSSYVAYMEALAKGRRFKSSPSLQSGEAHRRVDLTCFTQSKLDCSQPHEENKKRLFCIEKQSGVIIEDNVDSNEGVCSVTKKASHNAICDLPKILDNNCYVDAQPILDPIWRGSFVIKDENFDIVTGLAAHLSTHACSKVGEAARLLPGSLPLETLPRLEVCPRKFDSTDITGGDIGLYFFPEKERDERPFEKLLDSIIGQDLAMKAVCGHAELLLFTSLQLPIANWRYRGKYYLWGLFRRKKFCS